MSADPIGRWAADERRARHIGFWWGLAEAVAFFIVPDVYISAAALLSLRTGLVAWIASIAGSLAGVVAIRLAMAAGVDYLAFLDSVPAISAGLIARTAETMRADGLPYTPFLVLGGVPLKLYAATAFQQGLGLGAVLLWTLFSRFARIAPTMLVMAAVRGSFGASIDRRPSAWLAALGMFWVGFYALYFTRMGW